MARRIPEYLEGLFDFAGTFPPAAMQAEVALDAYRKHCSGHEGELVNSLAWSVQNLSQIPAGSRIEVSAIGRPSTDWDSWQSAREADAKDLNQFLIDHPESDVLTYEFRCPDTVPIEKIVEASKSLGKECDLYLEIGWDHLESIAVIAEQDWCQVKLRTGGATAQSFPTSEQVARAIQLCLDVEVGFKLTAGLHEPVAHLDSELGAFHHGFLNILVATSLHFHQDLTLSEMAAILNNADEGQWTWGENGVRCGDFASSSEELQVARSFLTTIGSCSISEPYQGLIRLEAW